MTREEAIKTLRELWRETNDTWYEEVYNMAIEALSAEAEWIPVSEILPIPPTFCLVTTDGSHGDVIDIALYMSDGWHKASEVLAWMPLPKPYGESEVKE